MKFLTTQKHNLREFIKKILTEDELSLDQIISKVREKKMGKYMTKQAFAKFINIKCRSFIVVRSADVPNLGGLSGTRKLSMYSVKPRFR